MIEYLKIINFGSVRDEVEISFEVAERMDGDAYEVEMHDGRRLLKLAYIYGANASGKTTIIKAFDFLRKILLHPVHDKVQELAFDPFLFCTDAYSKPSCLELAFYMEGIRHIYKVDFTKYSILGEKLLYYRTAKPTELFSRKTDPAKRLAKINFSSNLRVRAREKDLLESNTLHNDTILGAYAKTNVDIPEFETLNKWLHLYLLGTISSSSPDLINRTAELIKQNNQANIWINQLLNKADDQIAKVQVSDNDPGAPEERKIDFFHRTEDGNVYPLSIQMESNGTNRYFGLAGLLFQLVHGNHFLCIDELETSLHPDLMKHLLQIFLANSTHSQLLITTHNFSLMADPDFVRRDALWLSEKGNDGSVSIYSVADFDTKVLRKDASLINAYKTGRLGAKPNLGSPYMVAE